MKRNVLMTVFAGTIALSAVADQMVVRMKDGREIRFDTREVERVYFDRARESTWVPAMNALEPWWSAKGDAGRNRVVADPKGGAAEVLQVWGEHGQWATFRHKLPACTKLTVRGQFMFGGGDAGPWITIRDSFQGWNATDICRFGFDDRTYPPKIADNPVKEKTWYTFEFTVDMRAGKWIGAINDMKVGEGDADPKTTMNWLCLDAGQPGYFKDVEYRAE